MKNLIVLAVAVFAALALVELGVRLIVDDGLVYELEMWKYAKQVKTRAAEPDIGHAHRANAVAHLMKVDVRTNSDGFRGGDIARRAPEGYARIAFVGDSITLGWGVEEAQTFAARVIDLLRAKGRRVDGFNMGVGNYNTTQEFGLYRKLGEAMGPDLVVLAYFINDAEPVPKESTGWLDWRSAAWVVMNYRLDGLGRQLRGGLDWKSYYRGLYADAAPGWVQTQASFAAFADHVRRAGKRMVLFNIPEIREPAPYPFHDVTQKIRDMAGRSNVPFVDLLDAVSGRDPASLWVTPPDPHPNFRAHELFAQKIAESLLPALDELCAAENKGCVGPHGQGQAASGNSK